MKIDIENTTLHEYCVILTPEGRGDELQIMEIRAKCGIKEIECHPWHNERRNGLTLFLSRKKP